MCRIPSLFHPHSVADFRPIIHAGSPFSDWRSGALLWSTSPPGPSRLITADDDEPLGMLPYKRSLETVGLYGQFVLTFIYSFTHYIFAFHIFALPLSLFLHSISHLSSPLALFVIHIFAPTFYLLLLRSYICHSSSPLPYSHLCILS